MCNVQKTHVRVALAVAIVVFSAAGANAQSGPAISRGPLARLVKTPGNSAGLPPFALADQFGNIQRYVEPVSGIELETYVNQIVSVRHDTGPTLLASQLELPPQALIPMVGQGGAGASSASQGHFAGLTYGPPAANQRVEQAQHVDQDDSTVELLGEEETLLDGKVSSPPNAVPEAAIFPDGGYPAFPEGMPPGMGPMGADSACCDPMYCDPQTAGAFPSQYGATPCPHCGGSQNPTAHPQGTGFLEPFGQKSSDRAHLYAEVEINFLRAHVMEELNGKLSEKYEFSPRFIVGFTDVSGFSGRARYWTYGRRTPGLSDNDIRLDLDVLDIEATHAFAGRRSEVLLAAGLRLASFDVEDENEDSAGSDLIGLTLAADGYTPILAFQGGCVGWIYGGRLSILAGDWIGDNEIVDGRMGDDNVVVHELRAGVDFSRRYRSLNLHAQLAFEMQNWHSDVLSDSTGVDSIGFLGPGLRIGAEF